MSKILYDIGYGNDKPPDFLKRLKDARVTVVLDVRRKRSRSWCGAYRWGVGGGFGGVENLLRGGEIDYFPLDILGNMQNSLEAYEIWLGSWDGRSAIGNAAGVVHVMDDHTSGVVICLLCAERDGYKDGEVNCHRVLIADALVKLLEPEWLVLHL